MLYVGRLHNAKLRYFETASAWVRCSFIVYQQVATPFTTFEELPLRSADASALLVTSLPRCSRRCGRASAP